MLTSSIQRTLFHLYLFLQGDKTVYTLHTACMCVFDTRDPVSPHRYKRAKAQISADISEQPDRTETASQNLRSKMKAWFVLFLLLPLCMADHYIECYGEDFLMVRNMVLQCRSKVPQACYTRATGEKGCVSEVFCQRKGWKCCYENRCNA
uniref:Wu:fj16a03 n=2 Tax=Cyprinus carpio TaxID=7962 RepID=A0A8C2ESC9_CYPCA